MAKIIVVTSGKGGVGKTTTSASFATGLALRGHKTAVIDFDVGLRNLDLIMGCERRVVYDLINVIQGEATLNQALIKDKQCHNLFVLAASQTRDKDALTKAGVEKVLKDLGEMDFEYIVCDSPAGIETGALMAMHFADEALIVTNPEVSSVRDSDRILGMLSSKTKRAIDGGDAIKEHLLITRYNPGRVDQGQMLSLEDIKDILRIKLIGVIPESESVLQASNQGVPAVHMQGSDVSEAYKDVVDRFLGDKDALTTAGVEKVLKDLGEMDFEYIVCDSPAGIETGALMAMHFADEALIVTNPEVSSVRDSDRILGMLSSKTKRAIDGGDPIKEHLLITRYNPGRVDQGQMLSLEDIKDILRIKLIGVIPESESVLQASNQGVPAVHMQGSDVSEAYKDVVDRFLGDKDKPMRFIDAQKPGLFKRWFGGK